MAGETGTTAGSVETTPESTASSTIITEPLKSEATPAAPKTEEPKTTPPAAPTAPAPPTAPEKYELSLPEHSPLDEAVLERTAGYAKKQGLSNEQAQELVNRENQAVVDHVERMKGQLNDQVKVWEADVKADKEIGGDAFNKTVEMAKRVVNRHGSEAFKTALNETGLGSHPELIRFLKSVGESMTEDTFVHPGASVGKTRSPAEVLYGDTVKPEKKE